MGSWTRGVGGSRALIRFVDIFLAIQPYVRYGHVMDPQNYIKWWRGSFTPSDPCNVAPATIVPYLQLTNTVVACPSDYMYCFLNMNTGKNSYVASRMLVTDDDWRRAISDLL